MVAKTMPAQGAGNGSLTMVVQSSYLLGEWPAFWYDLYSRAF